MDTRRIHEGRIDDRAPRALIGIRNALYFLFIAILVLTALWGLALVADFFLS